jgi:hypothetical protein
MTKVRPNRPLTRETAAEDRHNPIVIVLQPKYLTVRLKGRREAHNVDYDTLLAFARRRQFEKEHQAAPKQWGRK